MALRWLFFLALLLIVSLRVSAQQLIIKVVDSVTKLPVVGATITIQKSLLFTDSAGNFQLPQSAVFDSVKITHVSYKSYVLKAANHKLPVIVYLQSVYMMLSEVKVKALRNFKTDSVRLRKEFAQVFTYKSTAIKDIFVSRSPYQNSGRPNNTSELVSVNVLQVISFLNKGNNRTSKLKEAMLRDEKERYVNQKFTPERVTQVTGLQEDSLKSFMQIYRPAPDVIMKMTDYDLIIYLKKSYADFVKR